MPPKAGAASRKRENMFFEPGVRGRKTGLVVPDSGIRDEDGLEPMDHLFSSPEKPPVAAPPPAVPKAVAQSFPQPTASSRKPANNENRKAASQNTNGRVNETIDTEMSMEIGHSTIPEPTAVLTERRKSIHMPPPRARSPAKTFLQSPARRHPSLGPVSSPTRGDIVSPRRVEDKAPVARKLVFSNDERMSPPKQNSPPKRVVEKAARDARTPKVNGVVKGKDAQKGKEKPKTPQTVVRDTPASEPSIQQIQAFSLSPAAVADDDYQPAGFDDDEQELTEEIVRSPTPREPTPPPKQASKKRGRTESREPSQPARKSLFGEQEISPAPIERFRDDASDDTLPFDEPYLPPTKKVKATVSIEKPATKATKAKSKAAPKATKPAVDESAMDSSPVQILRGPARPKQKGLFIHRRQPTGLGLGLAGNRLAKPLNLWKHEAVEYKSDISEDEESLFEPKANTKKTRRPPPSEDEQESPRPKKRGRPRKKAVEESEEEDEDALMEPWELSPGRITAPVKTWDPITSTSLPTTEDFEIAFSSRAIHTVPLPGPADGPPPIKFAKTLTLPFFGAGIVDLPPGSVKKLKNARKMQMVFFVHKGRVKVEVNGTVFGVGEGGCWTVPRGNAYRIWNEVEGEGEMGLARVWFAQGCEVEAGMVGAE